MICIIKEKKEEIDLGDLIMYKSSVPNVIYSSDGVKEIRSEYRRCLIIYRDIIQKSIELLDVDTMEIVGTFQNLIDIYNNKNYIYMICKSKDLTLSNL